MSSTKTNPPLPSYGAIARAEKEEDTAVDEAGGGASSEEKVVVDRGESFDTSNAYYLKATENLTFRKCMLITVPILAAVLIMGGFSLFLFKDFNHLYPGRHGGGERTYTEATTGNAPKTPHSTGGTRHYSSGGATPGNAPKTPQTGGGGSGGGGPSYSGGGEEDAGATCAVHPNCSDLVGNCCPTDDGKMLSCCES